MRQYYQQMNITSFSTSLEADRMTNIDSSSTAHLTMNAAGSSCSKPSKGSNNSDSDLERSPSVTVLKPTGSFIKHHHNHHHNSNHPNPFKLSWSRRSTLEKTLILFSVITTISLLLLTSSINILVSYRGDFEIIKRNDSIFVLDRHNNEQGEWLWTKCNENKKKNYCITPDCVKVAASVIEAIDTKVDPCDDFYMYSCGDWIKSNPLPDGKTNWGTFSKLWQDNQAIMRTVLESTNFTIGSAEEKAKVYYDSCLDRNDTVESRGPKPMQDLVDSAGGWAMSQNFDSKLWNLQDSLQIYHNQYNRGGLFTWAVGADERNSTRNIIQLDQGGLGLPSRDYYLNKTDKNVVDAYMSYMTKVMELMGGEPAKVEDEMKSLFEFERRMAEITVPQDQRRDDERMYHKFTLKELSKKAPFLNWTKYFDEAYDYNSKTSITFSSKIKSRVGKLGGMLTDIGADFKKQPIQNKTKNTTNEMMRKLPITEDEYVVIYSPEYFEDLSNLVTEYLRTDRGKTTLANYLAWTVIQSLVATLPKNFRDASKQLRKALIGSEGTEVSWRYCVTDTNQLMGFALGSLFVRRVFQGRSKERAEEMIFNIRNAFKDNLANLNWMDDRTRQLAREKADHINQMIGFPDFILSPNILNEKYEGLDLDEKEYFENNIKVNILALRENMEKINKPANKTEWEMTPPMVNAYYTPTKNQIVFPAGILQTPFYDLSFPNSLNYGAMGVVMGHELTHAFDDQGREYDKDGNLYQWWYNETLQNFEERVKCFVNQYSAYKVDDNYLNGRQTLGENIADNGGLKAAFRAYEKWSETHEEPNLPGLNLTSKQLFFVGFAQVWCSINTPEAQKLQVLNDPHAPAQFRVVGTLSNSDEFAREFNCPLGSKMNPDKKCIVW